MSCTHNTDSNLTSDIPQWSTVMPLKSMGHVPYIAKASKALKNSSGQALEINFSRHFHSVGLPLLVSPKLLRTRNLGQLDLGRIKKDREGWILEIAEVKSSEVGEQQMERFQKQRLFGTQSFLSGIFGFRSRL